MQSYLVSSQSATNAVKLFRVPEEKHIAIFLIKFLVINYAVELIIIRTDISFNGSTDNSSSLIMNDYKCGV